MVVTVGQQRDAIAVSTQPIAGGLCVVCARPGAAWWRGRLLEERHVGLQLGHVRRPERRLAASELSG